MEQALGWEPAHKQGMQGLDRAHHTMHVQPLWSLTGPGNGRRLRIYGFTDLPPSLPLSPADPVTRIPESNYRRVAWYEVPWAAPGSSPGGLW